MYPHRNSAGVTIRRHRITLAAVLGLLVGAQPENMFAQAFTFTAGNLIYNENFNALGISGTNFIAGWTSNDASMLAGNGSSSTGSVYNVGTTSATDRAFGSLANGSTPVPFLFFGASFLNNTGQTISSLNLAGVMEQWRTGASAGVIERDAFEYSLDAIGITSGTWAALPAFDLVEKLTASVSAAATNGNSAANRTAIAGTASLNWLTGTRLWIRWGDANDISLDGLYAIDDFSLSVSLSPPGLVWNPGPATWDTSTPNWLAGGIPGTFSNLDIVNFTDAGLASGATVTVVAGGVTPGNVNVSNTTGTYTLAGGPIGGSGNLTKSGAGTLTLATTYGGAVIVTGGTLRTGASEVLANGQPLAIGNGAVLDLAGNNETVGALALTGASVMTGAGTLILGGDVTIGPIAAAIPTVLSGAVSTDGIARTMNVADGAAGEDLIINANIAGVAGLTFTGAGTIRLNADNTGFAGGFRSIGSTGQTIVLGNSNALGSAQAELSGTTLSAVVPLTGANKVTTPIRVGATTVTIDMGNIELGGPITFLPAGLLRLTINTTAVLSGFLDTTPANATIQKTGTGTLTLNGTGTGSGKFQIDNGTVAVAGQSALGSALVSFRPVAGQSAILTATAPIVELGALDSLTGAGTSFVRIGGGLPGSDTELHLVGPQGATFSGAIQDASGRRGNLSKTGPGSQTLAGTNTYTGATNVSGGALIVSGSVPNTSRVTVTGDGVSGGTLLVNGSLTSAGGVDVSGGGALLGGSGQIVPGLNSAVAMGADTRLSPGSSTGAAGQLTITGQPLASPRGTFMSDHTIWVFDLNPPLPGGSADPSNLSGFDRISVVGNVVLSVPTLTLTSVRFESEVNDLFFILLNDGADPISGIFSGLPQGASVSTSNPVVTFTISYTGDSATNSLTGGNDVALLVTRAPEAGSFLFTVLGCTLIAAIRPYRAARSGTRTDGMER